VAIETHSLLLHTADGLRLDADLTTQPAPRAAAVLCHPHPLYGGDRHHPLLTGVAQRLAQHRVASIRFDFRGAGDSEGTHGGGVDERLDVAAAVDAVALITDGPVWVIGYSFGAAVALSVVQTRVDGWVAVAPPLAMMASAMTNGAPLAAADHRPKHLVVPRHDQYSPPEAVEPMVAEWANTSLVVVESADHFLAGHLARFVELAVAPLVDALA
jgi:alpha/beta superfamily hydrolase